MNDKYEYLSDDELEKLINDTEASGLLQAPLGFEKGILDRIENESRVISFDEKKKQYSRFRFQVCMAMAAAILLMVVAPMAMNSESGRQFKEATEGMRVERNQETNFVAGFLGNHSISDAMATTGFRKDMEE